MTQTKQARKPRRSVDAEFAILHSLSAPSKLVGLAKLVKGVYDVVVEYRLAPRADFGGALGVRPQQDALHFCMIEDDHGLRALGVVSARREADDKDITMDDEIAWRTKQRLWLEGISAYDEVLDPSCLMAFPGMGVLDVSTILKGLKGASRWTDVKMTDRILSRAGDDVVVLGYTAEGRRENAHPYRCFCTSTYRAEGRSWKLVQHQQTLAS